MKKITNIMPIWVALGIFVWGVGAAQAHTDSEEYQGAYFKERQKDLRICRKEKVNLLEDYAAWILPKMTEREQKQWNYAARGSNVLLQSSCPDASVCDSILSRFETCKSQATTCIQNIPQVEDASCSILLCYEQKVQCMGRVMTEYGTCVRSKIAGAQTDISRETNIAVPGTSGLDAAGSGGYDETDGTDQATDAYSH